MKILVVSDMHGDNAFVDRIEPYIREADLIIVAGDITHSGGKEDAASVIEAIRSIQPRLFAVPGNWDNSSVSKYLDSKDINLNMRVVEIDGIFLVGIGYSPPTPARTPNELSENDFLKLVNKVDAIIPNGVDFILVSHCPPFKTACDIIYSGIHVGSEAVRNLIEKRKPLACISGHIHEGFGSDRIGNSTILNPGSTMDGHFALLDLSSRPIRSVIRNFMA